MLNAIGRKRPLMGLGYKDSMELEEFELKVEATSHLKVCVQKS